MIGIIGAMDMEVEGLKSELTDISVKTISGMEFISGKLSGKDCVVAKCMPGKVNAAVCAEAMTVVYNPEMIISTGVAGGIGDDTKIGDLVVGTYCVQHDYDTHELDYGPGRISGIDRLELPCDEAKSEIVAREAKKFYDGKVIRGVIATGDEFICDSAKCKSIHERFSAEACEMESGSIAHVCLLNKLPFVAIRSISDNANDDASVDFLSFAKSSAEKAVKLIKDCIVLL